MPHIPYFPPEFDDWKPARLPFPPIPTFFVNPLTPEQRAALEEEFGPWAAGRTIGMLSPRETYETFRAIARSMYEPYKSRHLVALAPPALPTQKPQRVRKPRVPTIAEELAPSVGVLTPEKEAHLSAKTILRLIQAARPTISTDFKVSLAHSTIVEAEELGIMLPETEAARIVNYAIEQYWLIPKEERERMRREAARRA